MYMSIDTPIYRENIQICIHNLLQYMIATHNKVLPVRFDLRFPTGYSHDGHNHEVQYLARRVVQHYAYHGIECVYVIVREQNMSPVPHYHCLILLDGAQCQYPEAVKDLANHLWKDIVKSNLDGLVDYCRPHSGHPIPPLEMIRRPSSVATGEVLLQQQWDFDGTTRTVLAHGNYLAKEHTKGQAPKGVRELLASQIPARVA